MNDGRVARKLLLTRRPEVREQCSLVARPIGEAVDRSAIAEDHGVVSLREGELFELPLTEEDRSLHGLSGSETVATREATAEENARHLRQDCNVLAKSRSKRFEHGRLPAAGSAGQNDELPLVILELARTRRFGARDHG